MVERHRVARLIVVSSDFHLPRVEFIFRAVFPSHSLEFRASAYLERCDEVERDRLLKHEARELESLRTSGCSIVGGRLRLDDWKKGRDLIA